MGFDDLIYMSTFLQGGVIYTEEAIVEALSVHYLDDERDGAVKSARDLMKIVDFDLLRELRVIEKECIYKSPLGESFSKTEKILIWDCDICSCLETLVEQSNF